MAFKFYAMLNNKNAKTCRLKLYFIIFYSNDGFHIFVI